MAECLCTVHLCCMFSSSDRWDMAENGIVEVVIMETINSIPTLKLLALILLLFSL